MIRAIPTINTTRLTLRPMRAPDFDAFAALRRADGPVADSALWAAFLTVPGHWEMTGFGIWAITDRASDRVIGEAGFQDLRPGLGRDFDAFPQAQCTVVPDMRGRGIAHEAAAAAHDWFDRVVTGPVVARIGEGNAAALALAQTLNYRPVRALAGATERYLLLRRKGPRAPY